jgi:hypothetical protein
VKYRTNLEASGLWATWPFSQCPAKQKSAAYHLSRCPQPIDGANISNSVQHTVIWYDKFIVGWGGCPWEGPDRGERWLVFTLLDEWIAMPEHHICLYKG